MTNTLRCAFKSSERRLVRAHMEAEITASVVADYAVQGRDLGDWLTTDWLIRRAELHEARADFHEACDRLVAARAAA